MIADKLQAAGSSSIAIRLRDRGIPTVVRTSGHGGIMHMKLAIVDRVLVVGGSMNYTTKADRSHDEVLFFLRDKRIVEKCLEHFNEMWEEEGPEDEDVEVDEEE
jgi:phosphatidylserine/phosphatidylglycerophosphate/cardiolipin synthase-like enzyme